MPILRDLIPAACHGNPWFFELIRTNLRYTARMPERYRCAKVPLPSVHPASRVVSIPLGPSRRHRAAALLHLVVTPCRRPSFTALSWPASAHPDREPLDYERGVSKPSLSPEVGGQLVHGISIEGLQVGLRRLQVAVPERLANRVEVARLPARVVSEAVPGHVRREAVRLNARERRHALECRVRLCVPARDPTAQVDPSPGRSRPSS